jgi:hypothetical protein
MELENPSVRELYEKTYNEFETWCTEQQITNYTEPVFLAYFLNIAQRGLIASLWPKFSMLKSTLYVKKNIDIGKFNKLIMYIKRQTEGHVPKKSKVLEKEQVQKFILDAPNNLFLMTKVSKGFKLKCVQWPAKKVSHHLNVSVKKALITHLDFDVTQK